MESGLAQLLLEHSPDPLLLLAPDGSISFLNAAAEDLFGYSRAQLLGADSSLLLAEASREPFHGVLSRLGVSAPRSGQPFAGSGRRADGTEVPVEITCSLLPPDAGNGSPARSVALSVRGAGHRPEVLSGNGTAGNITAGNITAARQGDAGAAADAAAHRRRTLAASAAVPAAFAAHDDQLRAGVLRDPLTSLPNGTLFNERLAAALHRPDPVDVLLLNLDDFKNLNDMLGRSSADELLVEVASRLRNCVRPHDTVARLGGDEFVVLLTECLNADAVAKRISESLYEPLRVGGSLIRPGVSMGLASRTSGTLDGAELLRQADAAMTAAKSGGKNAWLRFRPEMLNTVVSKAEGQAGLRQAVELGQISVHYQPVVNPGLGAVVQFEAFARWERHGRLVPPNQFLPVAEQSGLIREIGDEVMRRACAEIRPWLAGDAAYSVAVNVSGLQFQNRDFATDVLAIVASTGVDPRQLMLELTESVFFESDSDVLRQLRQLREAGVRIAMDDFGTGYASLGRLKELPLDKVKIDRSFVAMIKTGQEHLPFFGTMINAAHDLGLKVTAEGIETPAQARYLMERGCDSLQGYLFAKPAPASDLAGTMESALTAIDKVDAAR
ncbi:putative bifunctional diguanylate cyclase/phosphodiesterase [Arthrobacter sp. TB 26]|uniref:putative bifunctional diguanylate cyclase/phosphodiesterase n=1 Tax=Arthrobacter sp. TB 26 TaxID=494420 RepID=UPI0004179C25|nr:bifunctional diguanylate cyclase/phosphodiesterase [Arthrobacter sp. TB 26]